ncbi:UNVERIFIED_CONTAM: hypothetical protein FKN15_006706 [Acipenser sinensis]
MDVATLTALLQAMEQRRETEERQREERFTALIERVGLGNARQAPARCPKLQQDAKPTAPAPRPSESTSPPGPSKRPAEGGKKAPAPLPGTSEGGKGEKAPEVAGPSAPPESAPGEKAAEWTVVARRIKKAAARSTGEAKRGETKPTAAPSGGGSGVVPDKETPSTAPPARQGGKAAR